MSLAAIAQVMQLCNASVNGHTAKLIVSAMYEFGLDKTVLCFTKVKYPPTPSYYPAFAAPPHFPEMVVRCNLGGTPLQEANRDVPLDGVAFSRLE